MYIYYIILKITEDAKTFFLFKKTPNAMARKMSQVTPPPPNTYMYFTSRSETKSALELRTLSSCLISMI